MNYIFIYYIDINKFISKGGNIRHKVRQVAEIYLNQSCLTACFVGNTYSAFI